MGNNKSILSRYWQVIRNRSAVSLGVVAVFFFLAGIAYMRLFDWTMAVTNTEQFCIGCHEMKDHVYPAYTESIHYSNRSGVRATCPDCHVPHKWSDKVVRKVQASREVWGKITGTINTPEKFAEHRLYLAKREWKRFKKNNSLECRNCHDEDFFAFERQGAPGTYISIAGGAGARKPGAVRSQCNDAGSNKMSTLESFVWHVLGYAAIPVIVLTGIFVATLLYILMLKIFGVKDE